MKLAGVNIIITRLGTSNCKHHEIGRVDINNLETDLGCGISAT